MPGAHKKRFFLIDGNSFCYRAFYAIRHLSNSKGQPTGAIYGVITMIRKIIKDEAPDIIAVAFDLKGPTFRHKKYAGYKITRKPMPDDLVSQLGYIKRVIRAYGISIYEAEGYEADDILGTLAKKAETEGIDTFLVTGDKDALQLVGPHTKVYNPSKDGLVLGEKEVRERFGVEPCKMTDLMALMGDASDSIPGVPGIGEKTARELMREFGSLEDILKNSDKIKSESRRKKIDESRELALLSKDLATIHCEVPIEADFKGFRAEEFDREALAGLFAELEFRNLLKEVAPKQERKGDYALVDCKKGLKELVKTLRRAGAFAFDFETTHHDPMRARPVGVSFCWKEGTARYVPLNALSDMRMDEALGALRPIFEDGTLEKIGQNIKYDSLILKNEGISVKGIGFDTMIASYLLNPSRFTHNLNDISFEYTGRIMGSIEELIGKGKKAITMDKVDVGKVRDYCCADSDAAFGLRKILENKLKEKGLYDLFRDVEMPLVDVLARMELCGVSVDTGYLAALSAEMEEEIKKLEKKIFSLAGEEFNIRSPKQLQVIFFEKLKMPIIKKTKTGASTDEEVLRTLSADWELPKEILRYRELAKLKSTYVDNVPGLINERTGRIHTSFNQAVTATGRLSSSGPNLQNIPIKTDMGKKIRKAFVAEGKSQILLSADYSQIELRILAHLSGDTSLVDAFRREGDVHKATASMIYGAEEKDVTPEMRSAAKTVNFGIVYGMSAYGLSRDLGIDVSEAAKFIDAYFERYPGIKEYLQSRIDFASKNGYVTTLLGRRRYIPEIKSENAQVRSFAERTAINTPIQGSAADLIKLAMINLRGVLDKFDAKMILQVHDELVFEVDEKSRMALAGAVKDVMEHVMKLKVPVRISLKAGKNWLEMEKVEV
ncbi:MAG: DNA polymerase I [Omnitrophica bacterium]|nr:DNA polymerase I [Candidatus Omnitrophota bacterium]